MEEYKIYGGFNSDRSPEYMAIHVDELSDPENKPEHYFLPGTTEIGERGTVQIEGDTHLLPTYFSVK